MFVGTQPQLMLKKQTLFRESRAKKITVSFWDVGFRPRAALRACSRSEFRSGLGIWAHVGAQEASGLQVWGFQGFFICFSVEVRPGGGPGMIQLWGFGVYGCFWC